MVIATVYTAYGSTARLATPYDMRAVFAAIHALSEDVVPVLGNVVDASVLLELHIHGRHAHDHSVQGQPVIL